MKKEESSFEQAFDMLLTEAAAIAADHIGSSIQEPQEEIEFSQEHKQKMQRLFKSEKNKLRKKKGIKYIKRCLCIAAIIAAVACVGVMSVSAWRAKILNFMMDIGGANSDYSYSEGTGSSYSDDYMTLGYIPEGYTQAANEVDKSNMFMVFENGENYFTVTIEATEGKASIDTEDSVVEHISINGYKAVYTSNKNINILIWGDDRYSYTITANIPKEEIVKIAENIKI